jgi:Flp pilus assembly protein TadG
LTILPEKVIQQFCSLRQKGQGLVELALVLPVILLLFMGIVELGFALNNYLAVIDAARTGSRYAATLSHTNTDTIPIDISAVDIDVQVCDPSTKTISSSDFYINTYCVVSSGLAQEKPTVSLDITNGEDDVVITVMSINGKNIPPAPTPPDTAQPSPTGPVYTQAQVTNVYPMNAGWSYALNKKGYLKRNQSTRFDATKVNAIVGTRPDLANCGIVIVEVFNRYKQMLGFDWLTRYVPANLNLYAYTIMPMTSAEPR